MNKMRIVGNDPLSQLRKASEEFTKRRSYAEYNRSQMSEHEYARYKAKADTDKQNAESLYVPKAIAEFKGLLDTFVKTEGRVNEARATALSYDGLSDYLAQTETQTRTLTAAELRSYAEDTDNLKSNRSLAKARYYAVMQRATDLIANSVDMNDRLTANEIYSIANRYSMRLDITEDLLSANKKMDAVFDTVFNYADDMKAVAMNLNNQDIRKALEHLEINRNVLPNGNIRVTLEVVTPEPSVRIVEPMQPIGGDDLLDGSDLRGLEGAPDMGSIKIQKRIKADISGISTVADMGGHVTDEGE